MTSALLTVARWFGVGLRESAAMVWMTWWPLVLGFNDDHLETHLSPAIRDGRPTLMLMHSLSKAAEALAVNHTNVIALSHAQENGIDGTCVTIDKNKYFFQKLAIWDIGLFITEVLEP